MATAPPELDGERPTAPNERAARRRTNLDVLRAALLLAPSLALAAPDDQAEDDTALAEETITVVATRTERQLHEVAANVTVKTAEQIEAEIARDIADLIRFEPGVSVGGTGARGGLAGFRIRGIGGNRVLTLIDGVRVPEEFSFGPFLSARRDLVDIDSLGRAEIVRGPVSALWGSDALGGVVALATKDPRQRLPAGETFGAAFKVGYSSADSSAVGTVDVAAANGPLSGMALYTQRSGNETDNAGSVGGIGAARERPDPQDAESGNLLAKVVYAPSASHRLTFGIDLFSADTATQVLSDSGSVVFGARVNSRNADDTRERTRGTFNYRYASDLGFIDSAELTLYRQLGETRQHTDEERTSAARVAQIRQRDSRYEQRIDGFAAQLGKRFASGGLRHALTVGVDYFATRNEGLRDGSTVTANGAPVREFPPLPTRDFPHTEVTHTALFAQDEIALLDGALLLSPGVRFDRFDAEAKADAIYFAGNPGAAPPLDYDDAEVTAKLGAVYRLGGGVSLYAGYSEGFRAPPFDDVNIGFSNFLGGYKTIVNADLESERSRGVELGVGFAGARAEWRWTVFRNDYTNFIESLALAPQFARSRGVDPADGLLTFQPLNREQVRIQGSELSGAAAFGRGVSGRLAIAYAEGEDRGAGAPRTGVESLLSALGVGYEAPLSGIEPLTAVLGLGYDAPSGRWSGELLWRLAQGKSASAIAARDPRPATAGYGVVDLLARVDLSRRARLNIGLFNLTDKTYVRWADTAGIGDDALARFTQPGVNGGITLRVEL